MIVGTGLDIVEIARIAALLERFPDRFRERCFTPEERAYCDGRKHFAQHYAARFAAKEAAFKAIGTGLRGVSWPEAAVTREPGHAPTLTLTGKAGRRLADIGGTHLHLSLTHGRDLAIAQVIIERRTGADA